MDCNRQELQSTASTGASEESSLFSLCRSIVDNVLSTWVSNVCSLPAMEDGLHTGTTTNSCSRTGRTKTTKLQQYFSKPDDHGVIYNDNISCSANNDAYSNICLLLTDYYNNHYDYYYSCDDGSNTNPLVNPCNHLLQVVTSAIMCNADTLHPCSSSATTNQSIVQRALEEHFCLQLSIGSSKKHVRYVQRFCINILNTTTTCCSTTTTSEEGHLQNKKSTLPNNKSRTTTSSTFQKRLYSNENKDKIIINHIRRATALLSLSLLNSNNNLLADDSTIIRHDHMSCDEVELRKLSTRNKTTLLVATSQKTSNKQNNNNSYRKLSTAACSTVVEVDDQESSVTATTSSPLLFYDSDPGEGYSSSTFPMINDNRRRKNNSYKKKSTSTFETNQSSFPRCQSLLNEKDVMRRSRLRTVLPSAFDCNDDDYDEQDNTNNKNNFPTTTSEATSTTTTINHHNQSFQDDDNAMLSTRKEDEKEDDSTKAEDDEFDLSNDNEYSIEQNVNKLFNSTSILLMHNATTSTTSCVNVWIERGTQFQKTIIHPKLMWAPTTAATTIHTTTTSSNNKKSRFCPAAACKTVTTPQGIELLSIIRIVPLHKGNKKYCFSITFRKCCRDKKQEQEQVFMFEAFSEEQLQDFIHCLKTVVARFASKIIIGDHDIIEEFYTPWNMMNNNNNTLIFTNDQQLLCNDSKEEEEEKEQDFTTMNM